MDSITHIALGACMGEAFAGRTVGRKALLWGALAQSIPDIDFISAFWMGTTENLLSHRGVTHSIIFVLLVSPMMAWVAHRLHRPSNISLRRWMLFFFAVTLGHIFVDSFNNYGVGWFEPFSDVRVTFNAIYVADPFFSIWSVAACVALLILPRFSVRRKFWWRFGLAATMVYMGYCVINKIKIHTDVKGRFVQQSIPHDAYFTTPAPLQSWLWFVVAGNKDGFYVGYHSVYDRNKDLQLTYFPRRDSLLLPFADSRELHNLKKFSKGFYTVEKYGDTLVFNDLRFGQVIGWHDPKERFAFHYYLTQPESNELVVQRGRFAKWSTETLKSLVHRVLGFKSAYPVASP